MAMKTSLAALCVSFGIGLAPHSASAQTATAEVDVTVGNSTENVQAASSQVRLFGNAVAGWEYFAEASWAQQWSKEESDAFGSAYPYDKRLRLSEAYVERTLLHGPYLAGVRAGQFRTPFGLSGRSDQGYNGFTRAPLIRYPGYWALSNNNLEGGVSVVAGAPRLFAEASVGAPRDQDEEYQRRGGVDTTVRVQGTVGALIVGVSHVQTQPSKFYSFASGTTTFTGVDVRWMYDGVMLRGEWIDGHPFNGTRTYGGYMDALVHRPAMGIVTAVFRAERLDYVAGTHSSTPRRYTTGARVRLSSFVSGQVNFVREPSDQRLPSISALDFSVTFSGRR
jgi:hypothetical protein